MLDVPRGMFNGESLADRMPISLTPGFSRVSPDEMDVSRFNGFGARETFEAVGILCPRLTLA